MEELDYAAARLWTKERIRAEIDMRRDELRASEEWVREQSAFHESNNYRTAESGWSTGSENYQMRLHGEIGYLVSLL